MKVEEMSMLRRICDVIRLDGIRNAYIRENLGEMQTYPKKWERIDWDGLDTLREEKIRAVSRK